MRLIDADNITYWEECLNGESKWITTKETIDEMPCIITTPVAVKAFLLKSDSLNSSCFASCGNCKHFREHDEIYKRMWKSEYDGHCVWWNAHSTHADGYCHEWKEKEVE